MFNEDEHRLKRALTRIITTSKNVAVQYFDTVQGTFAENEALEKIEACQIILKAINQSPESITPQNKK
jgi:hypothetical protein